MLLPVAERGQEGTPTWHHTNTSLPPFRMNDKVRAQFTELGSSHVSSLGFRDNWIFLGAKGLKGKSPFEEVRVPPLPVALEAPIIFIASPELHLTYLSTEDKGQWCYPPHRAKLQIFPHCKLALCHQRPHSFSLSFFFFSLQHIKNDVKTNKYDGWPELVEMEGCAPRKMD